MWTFDYESKKKFQFTYKINDLIFGFYSSFPS